MILLLSALIVLLIPGTMVLFGYVWKKHPPKTINGIYGYRTRRSMQNWATWEFAHQYCARLCASWDVLLQQRRFWFYCPSSASRKTRLCSQRRF